MSRTRGSGPAKVANPLKLAAPAAAGPDGEIQAPGPAKVANPLKSGDEVPSSLLAAFPGCAVAIRPRTAAPEPIVPGAWEVWSLPLPPRRKKTRPTAASLAHDPNACIHCGQHCPPSALAESVRLTDGRWEHLGCWLGSDENRVRPRKAEAIPADEPAHPGSEVGDWLAGLPLPPLAPRSAAPL